MVHYTYSVSADGPGLWRCELRIVDGDVIAVGVADTRLKAVAMALLIGLKQLDEKGYSENDRSSCVHH
jgi:hypothetical protein